MKWILVIASAVLSNSALAQGCCSGGGGNPMAGNASTGVLPQHQYELRVTHQYNESSKFLCEDRDTVAFFEKLHSNYAFLKLDYGLSDNLTLSLAAGYYLNRTITEFSENEAGERNQLSSGGIGDLMIFPRYNIISKNTLRHRNELTMALGLKIPLGSHDDTTLIGHSYFVNMNGGTPFLDSTEIWQTLPPTIQATTGSNDVMLYANYLHGFNRKNLRVFANVFYIRKGWNSLGQRFGDFSSFAIAADQTIYKNFGIMLQCSAEHTGKLESHKDVDQLGLYGVDQESTGSFKFSVLPQLRYSFRNGMTVFVNSDIPIYQYMNGTQIGAQVLVTTGINYRFYINKKHLPLDTCVADAPGVIRDVFKVWGNCDMCKEKIEETVNAIRGVDGALWDHESLQLTVIYKENKTSLEEIKQALAEVGYDTETHRTSKEVYNALPECCKYKRPD